MLAGIGFTVSLLIGDLAYGVGSERDDTVKIGVLTGSLTAAILASIVLRLRNRHYRLVCEQEARDRDHDGVPDSSPIAGRVTPHSGRCTRAAHVYFPAQPTPCRTHVTNTPTSIDKSRVEGAQSTANLYQMN